MLTAKFLKPRVDLEYKQQRVFGPVKYQEF